MDCNTGMEKGQMVYAAAVAARRQYQPMGTQAPPLPHDSAVELRESLGRQRASSGFNFSHPGRSHDRSFKTLHVEKNVENSSPNSFQILKCLPVFLGPTI